MKVKLLSKDAILPTKAHDTDAGFDLYIPFDFLLKPITEIGYVSVIEVGIAVEVPDGKFSLMKERSSLANRGMVITGGVIDYGYRGELAVICHNVSFAPIQFLKGQKIAQLLVLPFYGSRAEEVEDVSKTKRGEKGFGSSDKLPSEEEVKLPLVWECGKCTYTNRDGWLHCRRCNADRKEWSRENVA